MSEPLVLRVRAALSDVVNPASGRNIVAEGAVHGLSADARGAVRFTLQVDAAAQENAAALLDAAKKAASGVGGVSTVSAVATAHSPVSSPTSSQVSSPVSSQARAGAAPPASGPPARSAASKPPGGHDNPLGLKKRPRIEEAAQTLAGVQHVIAVASGKGGVGKSTLAANLAVALARTGRRVGLMDADIYGPSLPILFGLSEKPAMREGKIVPPEAYGVRAMSMGLMVGEAQSLAWRGPMVMGAVRQLMSDVDWGALDILLIDTPPGTGDAHLSLIQSKRLSGAVIVSTPQEMALADVRRGVQLFRKTETPVIGVVENMAWLELASGERQYLFGRGGAQKAAAALEAPFLGAIPLHPELQQASDAGTPLAAREDHPAAADFRRIADAVLRFVETR